MRAVIQRVINASVTINKQLFSEIQKGLLIFVGIEDSDSEDDINWICNKISNLRVFNDSNSVMNLSVINISGELLVVSQFTLHAAIKKGNRPSYLRASKPEVAIPLYTNFIKQLSVCSGLPVKTGLFGADMKVAMVNDGPVTIIMDSKNKE
jgi:D-aminoacyl-tRNA deacylase